MAAATIDNKAVQSIIDGKLEPEDAISQLLSVYSESAATAKHEQNIADQARLGMQLVLLHAGMKECRVGPYTVHYIPATQPGQSVDTEKFLMALKMIRESHPSLFEIFSDCLKTTSARSAYVKVATK